MPASAMPFQPVTIAQGFEKLGFFEEIIPPVYILPVKHGALSSLLLKL